jgi:hypothetical protein
MSDSNLYLRHPMNTGFEPFSQGPVYIDYSPSGAP